MSDHEKLEQLLATQEYMVVAVISADGTPWAVPVRLRDREGLRVFEWDSALATVHSRAIAERPVMSVTIFQKNEDSQIGFYARGTGELVEEIKPGFGRYRFVAKQAWINDETFVKREVALS